MRKHTLTALFCLLAGASACIVSCKKEATPAVDQSGISQETLSQIKALGFSTADVHKVDGGYLVEGDILLSEKELTTNPNSPFLRTAKEEQYRTNNLVTVSSTTVREITVRVSNLGTAFVTGADTAIARYNRLGLRIRFRRITSGTANITITGFNEGPSGGFITLGSAGFPTSSGNPFNSIRMNTNAAAYGSNPNVLYVGSVIQHEIGHCVGFRHTDYFNRALSCGGSASNEGSAGVGAILIPGTPSGNSANSWMLACSNGGNRTFNSNDIVALNYLY